MSNKGQAFVESLIFNLFFIPMIFSFIFLVIQFQSHVLIEDLIERYLFCEIYSLKTECELKFKKLVQENNVKILDFKSEKSESKIRLFLKIKNIIGQPKSYQSELIQESIDVK